MPRFFMSNMKTSLDWEYSTQPNPGACRGYTNKGCAWPRGKVLGGSSSINAMFYVRGNKLDFDEWAALGNEHWGYDDVLPYFKKSENFVSNITSENTKYHGYNGYLGVDPSFDIHNLEKILLAANGELGMKILQDINGDEQMGVTVSQTTIKDGVRQSTARAFLSPIKNRPNLHVLKNALVKKIEFEKNSNQVKGVLISKDGQDISVCVKKELVISAGSVNTPQLLLLSGIGPVTHLKEHGIYVKADLPVGQNLQDHPFVPITFIIDSDVKPDSISRVMEAMNEFLVNRSGPLAGLNINRVMSFINTTDPDSSSPDIQRQYFYLPPGSSMVVNINEKHGVGPSLSHQIELVNKEKLILEACSVLLRPKSRGKIVLKNKNPNESPLIYANYFEDHEDIKTVVKGMKHVLKLAETNLLKTNGFKVFWPNIDSCAMYEKNSDDFLECFAREYTFSLYHPVGTAKMGPDGDSTSVVDPELKVRGVKKLRVIDASIMPLVTRGNTNAATIMIGEKGADLIKKDWLPSEGKVEL